MIRCSADPIALGAEVVVAILSDLFFWHDLGCRCEGEDGLSGRFSAQRLKVGRKLRLNLRKVVLIKRAPLRAKTKPIILHFEKCDGVGGFG